MPSDPTPPDLPKWDPAAWPEEATLPEGMDPREWVLVRYVGQPAGETIVIPLRGLEVGRAAENGLCLPDPEVSRRHASLAIATDGLSVELRDLGSTNGLFVNGRRVHADPGPVSLQAEDALRVGGHVFKLKHMDPLEQRFHRDLLARTTLDAMTGLNNRATILHQLEAQVELARRHHRPLSLLLADLDSFKEVNDTYGHRAGDLALEGFSSLLRGRLRASDAVGRLGGDEFVAILPETPVSLALSVAEDFRLSLEAKEIVLDDGRVVHITCSLGVAELKRTDVGGGAFLARADAALYGAKAGGRNRAVPAP